MKEFTCILGDKSNGLKIGCRIENDNVYAIVFTLLLYGCEQIISITDYKLRCKLNEYATKEYNRQQRYRRIEQQFKEFFGETIDIQNEDAYSNVLYEWNKRTEDDTRMLDLNGDLKAF